MNVLDVGCGRQFPMARKLLALGACPQGIDPAAEACRLADGAKLVSASIYATPYPDRSFDVIISQSVLEHLHDPLAAFGEVNRILKPGGRFVFLAANVYDYVSILALALPNWLHGRIVEATTGRDPADTFPTYYRANSAERVRQLAGQSNFIVESLAYLNQFPYMLMFSPTLCGLVIAYDELISRLPGLHCLKGWLLGCLRTASGTCGNCHSADATDRIE